MLRYILDRNEKFPFFFVIFSLGHDYKQNSPTQQNQGTEPGNRTKQNQTEPGNSPGTVKQPAHYFFFVLLFLLLQPEAVTAPPVAGD